MCFYTQRLGSLVPSCWVASYPFVGWTPTHSLGTIVLLRWVQLYPFVGYKTDREQAQGLLKRPDSVPADAVEALHANAMIVEVQVVRAVAAHRVSTRRPIVALAANAGQLT